jgi:hypothetical protein
MGGICGMNAVCEESIYILVGKFEEQKSLGR